MVMPTLYDKKDARNRTIIKSMTRLYINLTPSDSDYNLVLNALMVLNDIRKKASSTVSQKT